MASFTLNIANELLQEESQFRSRQRGKLGHEQFITAVSFVLNEVIQAYCAHPNAIAGISRNKNTYGNRRYAPKGVTATALLGRTDNKGKKKIGALDLLQVYGWIRQVKGGFFNHINGFGEVTKYQATEKLIHQINDPVMYPVSSPTDLDQDTIILRDRGDNEEKNRRKVIDFTDNEQTILWRTNLRIINKCLSSH